MKCEKHKKDHVGGCQWCGKRICQYCVARADGKKLFCEKCTGILSPLTREHMPVLKEAPQVVSGERPKFIMKDGYLVVEGYDEH